MFCVRDSIKAMTGIDLPLSPSVLIDDIPPIIRSIGLRFHEPGMPVPDHGIVFYRYTRHGSECGHAEYTDDCVSFVTHVLPVYAERYEYSTHDIIGVAIP